MGDGSGDSRILRTMGVKKATADFLGNKPSPLFFASFPKSSPTDSLDNDSLADNVSDESLPIFPFFTKIFDVMENNRRVLF